MLPKTPRAIAEAIYAKGPVAATFNVYDDFVNYRRGIYVKTSDKLLGVHSVKIIGWGYDYWWRVNYWIVANSWSTRWGDGGYFKIQFGQVAFEEQVWTCDALI